MRLQACGTGQLKAQHQTGKPRTQQGCARGLIIEAFIEQIPRTDAEQRRRHARRFRHGRIDACLIHVGGPPKGDLLDIAEEDWDRANEMVIKPVLRMAKLLTPVMEAQGGGSIVNITTFSAFEPSLIFPTSSVYRAGVSSFTKLYSDRYGPANIRMNCLLPGFTDSLDLPQKYADMSALGRLARAEEQGKVAAFLLTDDSSYITGQSLRVDGGVTRHM